MKKGWLILAIGYFLGAFVALPFGMMGFYICGGCGLFCLLEGANSARSARRTAEFRQKHGLPARQPSRLL